MEKNAEMELFNMLKDCKSAEELQALAQEHGCSLTQEQACTAFDEKNKLNMSCADLSDEDLENVVGGSLLGFLGGAVAGGAFYDLLKSLFKSQKSEPQKSEDGWSGVSGSWEGDDWSGASGSW